ncbi:hypothetical protein NC652_004064 [Populus alba x Populus x berolinensis]|nr:hypothetical protein NC652_004064 [Populus alba x Populus x berolinensis]
MEKEDTKLMKLEKMDKDDYPEELREQGAAALLLSCLLHTRLTAVRRSHFDDQQGEDNSNAAARNLPEEPPIRSLEAALRLIENYVPHEVPSIPGLNGIIGRCSKPFEKHRLSINKADAQKYLYPLLNEDENLAEGINEFEMVFKIWVSKNTEKLCFVINWRRLPGVTTPIKRKRVTMNKSMDQLTC